MNYKYLLGVICITLMTIPTTNIIAMTTLFKKHHGPAKVAVTVETKQPQAITIPTTTTFFEDHPSLSAMLVGAGGIGAVVGIIWLIKYVNEGTTITNEQEGNDQQGGEQRNNNNDDTNNSQQGGEENAQTDNNDQVNEQTDNNDTGGDQQGDEHLGGNGQQGGEQENNNNDDTNNSQQGGEENAQTDNNDQLEIKINKTLNILKNKLQKEIVAPSITSEIQELINKINDKTKKQILQERLNEIKNNQNSNKQKSWFSWLLGG